MVTCSYRQKSITNQRNTLTRIFNAITINIVMHTYSACALQCRACIAVVLHSACALHSRISRTHELRYASTESFFKCWTYRDQIAKQTYWWTCWSYHCINFCTWM